MSAETALTPERLRRVVEKVLEGKDVSTVTVKDLRLAVENDYGTALSAEDLNLLRDVSAPYIQEIAERRQSALPDAPSAHVVVAAPAEPQKKPVACQSDGEDSDVVEEEDVKKREKKKKKKTIPPPRKEIPKKRCASRKAKSASDEEEDEDEDEDEESETRRRGGKKTVRGRRKKRTSDDEDEDEEEQESDESEAGASRRPARGRGRVERRATKARKPSELETLRKLEAIAKANCVIVRGARGLPPAKSILMLREALRHAGINTRAKDAALTPEERLRAEADELMKDLPEDLKAEVSRPDTGPQPARRLRAKRATDFSALLHPAGGEDDEAEKEEAEAKQKGAPASAGEMGTNGTAVAAPAPAAGGVESKPVPAPAGAVAAPAPPVAAAAGPTARRKRKVKNDDEESEFSVHEGSDEDAD